MPASSWPRKHADDIVLAAPAWGIQEEVPCCAWFQRFCIDPQCRHGEGVQLRPGFGDSEPH